MHKFLNQDFKGICKNLSFDINLLNGKSFLITGANGLIGSYFVYFLDYLNQNFNTSITIYAMSRSKERLEKSMCGVDVIIIEQDLNEPLAQKINADYIIHAASNAHPLAYSKDPVGTMKTNLVGTMNLLESLKNSSSKFLYVSSGEIYGSNIDHAFTEDDIGIVDSKTVRSCYPESKRAAETLCMAYNSQFGIKVNVARLCYVYGPTITDSNSRADAQFLRNALNGEDIIMKSEGSQRRTYCYVSDVIAGLLTILINGQDAEVYNIANPNSIVSIKEYAEILCELSGTQLKFELPDEIEKRGYSKSSDSILDATKLINLGWKPQINIKEGLKNTITNKRSLV